MSAPGTRTLRASAAREVAYPVDHVWRAMATLPRYCSVCDVSAIVDSPGPLGRGTEFRAFPGPVAGASDPAEALDGAEARDAEARDTAEGSDGAEESDGAEAREGSGEVKGGMPGEIVEWSPRRCVATLLKTGGEDVVVRVDMAAASPDTTLVTISVEVTPLLRSRVAAAMTRSSYARMARRTVEGEIDKLPAHLALLDDHQV